MMNHSNRPSVVIGTHRANRQLRVALTMLVAAVCAAGATRARAEAACDAPWMHPGGGFTITSMPSQRSVVFTVTSFSKRDGNNCNGDARATMKTMMGGQLAQSESRMHFEIVDGKVAPPTRQSAGTMQGQRGAATFSGSASLNTSGVLSYVGEITGEGQRIAGTRTQGTMSGMLANMGQAIGTMNVPKFVIITSDKLVGKQEQLQTAVGKFACWPVTYERSMQADQASMMNHTANLAMTSHVVDHFCPGTGLVMRQDMTTDGRAASQTISALH